MEINNMDLLERIDHLEEQIGILIKIIEVHSHSIEDISRSLELLTKQLYKNNKNK